MLYLHNDTKGLISFTGKLYGSYISSFTFLREYHIPQNISALDIHNVSI